MTTPLITVTSEEEAKIVADKDVEIVDVKNPEEGSLGCASIETIENIKNVIGKQAKVSVALGDLPHLPGTVAMTVRGALRSNPDYIKIGLKGPENREDAVEELAEAVKPVEKQEGNCKLVAAAYADHETKQAISPEEAVKAASEAGLDGIMMDTLSKEGGNLFSHKSIEDLNKFVEEAKSERLEVALAGSIQHKHIEDLKKTKTDIIGVRGAICSKKRGSSIDEEKLERLLRRF